MKVRERERERERETEKERESYSYLSQFENLKYFFLINVFIQDVRVIALPL